MARVVPLATARPRSARSLLNRAYTQLGQAESSWARLVEVVEQLALLHGDQAAGPVVRDVQSRMHALREVLAAWSQD
jgi:hypothetical protein